MALITIIVPIYNTEQYLTDCIESIKKQSFTDWSCYLINDGSTDNSQLIIDKYCQKDSRFVAFSKKNEKSIDLARKYGIIRASTEWLVHIDSDDAIEPTYLEKLVKRQQETGADVIEPTLIGCVKELEGESYRLPVRSFNLNNIFSGREACLMTIGGWEIPGQGNLYKRELLNDIEWGEYANTDELTARKMLLSASRVACTNAKYFYRANEGTSSTISPRLFARSLVDIQLEQFVYENFPEQEDKIKKLAWQRLFNLIYLTADYNFHKKEFTKEEQLEAIGILRKSYKTLNRTTAKKAAPIHAMMLTHSFLLFSILATTYVRYKRSHGGKFYYR